VVCCREAVIDGQAKQYARQDQAAVVATLAGKSAADGVSEDDEGQASKTGS
jgi:hypothetical protein